MLFMSKVFEFITPFKAKLRRIQLQEDKSVASFFEIY